MTIEACVFDAFGTLFKIDRSNIPISKFPVDQLLDLARVKQLEYTWLFGLMDKYVDFGILIQKSLEFAFNELEVSDHKLKEELQAIFFQPNCFEEVPNTLQSINESGRQTAILSNGTPEMLTIGVEKNGLSALLNHVLSVDLVKTFKPSPKVYDLAVSNLGLDKHHILFVSSNQWDVAGAAQFGFNVSWINRFGAKRDPILQDYPVHEFDGTEGIIQLLN